MSDDTKQPAVSKRTAVFDLMAITGLGLLTYGSWLAWPPLGFMVPGALLIAGAVAGAKR